MAEIQCDYCKGQGYIHRVFYGGARGGNGDYTCPKCNGSGVLAQPAQPAAANADGAVTGDGVGQTNLLFERLLEAVADEYMWKAHQNDGELTAIRRYVAEKDAELTRQRERADAAERERDELARELQAARTKQAEHSEIEDLLMERGELTPGVSLSKQVADLLSKLETRRDVLEAESDELQAAVNAAVAGVDALSPLEALTRLLELRRRVSGS